MTKFIEIDGYWINPDRVICIKCWRDSTRDSLIQCVENKSYMVAFEPEQVAAKLMEKSE